MEHTYDSTVDTNKHQENIKWVYFTLFEPLMRSRILNHDQSKLADPEKACYDKYIPELRKNKFGSPEYKETREKMKKEGLEHHWMMNRHHPEHFGDARIQGMHLIDFVEHVLDCYASRLESDTGFSAGMEKVMQDNGYPEELKEIIRNTDRELFNGRRP